MAEQHESTYTWKVNITEFTRAMREAKRYMAQANAEFSKSTADVDKWSNSVTGVESKIEQLNKQLTGQQRVLDVLNQKYNAMSESQRENTAEGQKLKTQITNQEAAIKKTQSQIGYYNNQLNKLQTEQKESETALGKTTKAIEEQETKLSALKDEYKNAVLQYGKNSEQAKKLASEIDKLSSELADNKKKLNDADKAADEFDHSLDALDDTTNTVSEGFTVMKGALANLVSQGISKVIEGVKRLATETFNAGATFESSMSNVAAISGATASEMEKLTEKAEEMGSKTKFTASEAADAFSYMAMAGWKTEDMLNGIEGIMNLAAAAGSDLATTSDIVTDALTAMGYSAADAGRLADVMAAASSNANTNVELMGMTFQYAAPIVGALGYSMEDTAVAIGLMANAGIKGEKAGTALRSILTRLSAPPKDCATAMEALGISLTDSAGNMKQMDEVVGDLRKAFDGLSETEQTAMAKNIAGQEAMSGLLAIVRAAPKDYQKLTLAVENSAGAAERMANVMNDNVGGQITLLKSKIEGIMIKTFEKMSTSIRKALTTVDKALDNVDWDKFADNAGDAAETVANFFAFVVKNGDTIVATLKAIAVAFVTYKAVSTITAVVGAFKTLFTTIKAGESVMALFNSTLAMNPIGLVAAGVAGLVTVVGVLAKKNQEAMQAQYGLNEEQQKAIDDIAEMTEQYNNLKNAREEAVSKISAEYDYLNSLKNQYNGLIDANGKVKEGYEDRANFILNQLAEAMGVEVDNIKEMIDANGKLGDSIDEVLRKKQAEAVLMAYEEEYKNAITNRATAFDKLVKAQKAVTEADEKYKDTQAELNKVMETYNEMRSTSAVDAEKYLSMQGKVIEANEIAKNSFNDASKKLIEAENAWVGYNTTIQNYEGLSAAIISGDSAKIQEALNGLQNGFITAENSNRESLENQVENYKKTLQDLQFAIEAGTPYVTQEMVDQAKSMVDAAEAELEKFPPEAAKTGVQAGEDFSAGVGSKEGRAKEEGNKVGKAADTGVKSGSAPMKTSGETAGGNFATGVGSKSGAADSAGNRLGTAADTGAQTGSAPMNATGANAGDQFNAGIDSKDADAKTAGTTLANEAKAGADSVDATSSGEHFGDGFLSGIGSKIKNAWSKGWELAANALSGLRAGGGEGSPWKKAIPSGNFFVEGFIEGINDMIPPVTNAASDVAKAAIDALGTDMNNQMRLIGVDGGNSLIDGVNSVIPNVSNSIGELKAGVASANATMSNDNPVNLGSFEAGGTGDTVQNVTFNQTINSPKAVDRLTLYRQTNSLLFSAKVRLGNV